MDVYRNLNKPGVTFSMRERGRVIGHTQSITLVGYTFKHATQSQQANCRLKEIREEIVSNYDEVGTIEELPYFSDED